MKAAAITVLALAGTVASAQFQKSARVFLAANATTVRPGDAFTITATATGDRGIFAYNLLVDVFEGADRISHVSDLVDNPTGTRSIFGALDGQGLGAGATGLGVDRQDVSSGILVVPVPIDNIPFFTFTVHVSSDAELGTITYGSAIGSSTQIAALQFPGPPGMVVLGEDYPIIDFGSVSVSVVPAPAGIACMGVASLGLMPRRRSGLFTPKGTPS